jgi:hypothetical protein
MIQEDPDLGWRAQYGAEGTEEVVPVPTGADPAPATAPTPASQPDPAPSPDA